LHPSAIHAIVSALNAHPDRQWGAMRQSIADRRFRFRLLECGNAARVRLRGIAFGDQGLFLRRDAFDAVGGFSQTHRFEDLTLARMMRRRSWPLLLSPPLQITPRHWQHRGILRQTIRNHWLQWTNP
jgi:GT2 family glycosyltransferase